MARETTRTSRRAAAEPAPRSRRGAAAEPAPRARRSRGEDAATPSRGGRSRKSGAVSAGTKVSVVGRGIVELRGIVKDWNMENVTFTHSVAGSRRMKTSIFPQSSVVAFSGAEGEQGTMLVFTNSVFATYEGEVTTLEGGMLQVTTPEGEVIHINTSGLSGLEVKVEEAAEDAPAGEDDYQDPHARSGRNSRRPAADQDDDFGDDQGENGDDFGDDQGEYGDDFGDDQGENGDDFGDDDFGDEDFDD